MTNLLESVVSDLKMLGRGAWPEIARQSGIAPSTLEKIAYGVTKNPGWDKVQKLAGTLSARAKSTPNTESPPTRGE